jgi:hypothetical protein
MGEGQIVSKRGFKLIEIIVFSSDKYGQWNLIISGIWDHPFKEERKILVY